MSTAPPEDDPSFTLTCPYCRKSFLPSENPPQASPGEGPLDVTRDAPADLPFPVAGPSPSPGAESQPVQIARFQVRRFVGEGGFGRVYEAFDPTLKRTVAVKVARSDLTHSAERVERFRREAQAAARLAHPNIVSVFDSGQDGSLLYIASAFVTGQSLDVVLEELPEGRRLPVERAVQIVRRLAEALAYAHGQGVIHRDVKPANVMLREEDDEPLLMDFGLARRSDEVENLTVEGRVLGTVQYMAPEQAEGKAEAASDQYSLGCLLFQLLTGQLPFSGATAAHFVMLHRSQAPPALRSSRPRLPQDVETICLKCLEKEPAKRYTDCQELADDLRRWLEDEPIKARRMGLVERGRRWARREPRLVASIGVAVTALVGVAVVLGVSEVRQRETNHQLRTAIGDRDTAAFRLAATVQELKEEKTKLKQETEAKEKANAERIRQYRMAAYVKEYTQALRALERMDIPEGQRILDRLPEDLRSWEWYHAVAQCERIARTFVGHSESVSSVAISPDGKWIVSGSRDSTVKVWDSSTGQELLTLRGHTGPVNGVAINPDGQRIVSGSADRTVKVWDAASGKELLTLKGITHWVNCVAISPDGKRIVAGDDGDRTVKVWDSSTGQLLLTLKGHSGSVSMAISPDGKRIVSGSDDNTVKVWDAGTGQELLTLKGHTGPVTSVSCSPDGKQIASGSRWDRTVKVWDSSTGQNLFTFNGHLFGINSVAISPDGKRIVSGSADRTVKVWDADKGVEIFTLKGHTSPVLSVAFSADGNRIVSGSQDRTVKVWDSSIGQDLLCLKGHTGPVNSVAITPIDKRIVSGGNDGTVKIWGGNTGQELFTLKVNAIVKSVAISPDSKQIISGDQSGTVRVWDSGTGEELLAGMSHASWVNSVAISPNGQRIVSESPDGTVKVWESRTGRELLTLKGHTGWVRSVAISPDGQRIVSGGEDNTMKVWESSTGQELLTLQGRTNDVRSVAISPDGQRIVSGNDDSTVKVWDSSTGQELLTLQGHTGPVNSVAISPDGQRIVSGSDDSMVKLWDSSTGMELLTLRGHTDRILSVSFSPDGKQIASGSRDRTVKVWDADPGQRDQPASQLTEPQRRHRLSRLLSFDPNWHRREADTALAAKLPFATAFHLDALLSRLPNQRREVLGERNEVLFGMLTANQRDPYALRRLARCTLWAPNSVPNQNRLLPGLTALLKDQPTALTQRVHAGLLVRLGSSREALPPLQALLKTRDKNAPPVEELLLALAHLDLEQPADARKHLDAAVRWLDQGTPPLNAATLVAAGAAGWSGLGMLALPASDPRLEPRDWETRLELKALRQEVELKLAQKR
jgi:WD40 repeat protein/tRNA A-37 threonylcarbamoyl transferase component Bud32